MGCNDHSLMTREEIEDALLACELTERRAALARQVVLLACELKERRVALVSQFVLLVVTVAFAVASILCALRGYHWPALATGGSSGLTAAVSTLGHRSGG
jgi:hypothetical protein